MYQHNEALQRRRVSQPNNLKTLVEWCGAWVRGVRQRKYEAVAQPNNLKTLVEWGGRQPKYEAAAQPKYEAAVQPNNLKTLVEWGGTNKILKKYI